MEILYLLLLIKNAAVANIIVLDDCNKNPNKNLKKLGVIYAI